MRVGEWLSVVPVSGVAYQELQQFLMAIVLLFGNVALMHQLLADGMPVDIYSVGFNWIFLGILLVPVVAFVVWRRAPLWHYGVTWSGWQRSLKEGLVLSSLFVVGLTWIALTRSSPESFGQAVAATWHENARPIHVFYFLHCYLQEFIGRGVIQGTVQRLVAPGLRGMVLASLIFAISHLHFGLTSCLVVFCGSLVFGSLYVRHRNLLGVAVFHYLVGLAAFYLNVI